MDYRPIFPDYQPNQSPSPIQQPFRSHPFLQSADAPVYLNGPHESEAPPELEVFNSDLIPPEVFESRIVGGRLMEPDFMEPDIQEPDGMDDLPDIQARPAY